MVSRSLSDGSICMALVNSGKTNESIDPEVLEDLSEVLSKCMSFLENIVGNLQNSWKCDETEGAACYYYFSMHAFLRSVPFL